MPSPCIAIVAYPGVAAAEAEAFRNVFGSVPGARVVTVGPALGVVAGAGGVQLVDAAFDDVTPDVIAVPGGLGSHRHPEVASWIGASGARYVVASSTGVGLLGAGGLLIGRRVSTHWLAGAQVTGFGAEVVDARVTADDPFITCQGAVSAIDAALLVVRALGGERLVGATRAEMAARALRPVACPRTARRWRRRARRIAKDPSEPVEVVLDEHDPRP